MRLGRLATLVSLATILTLIPAPWGAEAWGALARWQPPTGLWRVAHAQLAAGPPFGGPAQAAVRPQISSAFPPERVAIMDPNGLGLGSPAKVRPAFDFAGAESKGPGLVARFAAGGNLYGAALEVRYETDDRGAYPIEVDPSILTAGGVWNTQPAPFQRTSVAARDGTHFHAFYNPAAGLQFVTSTDNWTSVSAATTIVSSEVEVALPQESGRWPVAG